MNSILVPTDFSDQAANALDFAAQVALKNDAKVL
ncbi:MAG: universal stress protein, partial [Bacteroidota bacterium]